MSRRLASWRLLSAGSGIRSLWPCSLPINARTCLGGGPQTPAKTQPNPVASPGIITSRRRSKPLLCLAIRLIRQPTSFVLLSGRSRFDSWRGHGGGSLVLVRVSGNWVLRTVRTTCARLPPFPCLNMAFYPRPWSPTLLIESRCANQLLSCLACWCGGWRWLCGAKMFGQSPAALQFPLMHNQQRPNASGSCRSRCRVS
jgi:hypothetical protein